MNFRTGIRELQTKYRNWLGATPIKSSSLDENDEKFIKQYLSAKDDEEAEVILEEMFGKMLEDMPTQFDEDELVAEEDLPHWLRENTDESSSKPLPELTIDDDVWVEDDKKSANPLVIIFVIVILSTTGLLAIGFFGEKVLWVSIAISIPILVVGIIAGQVVIVRNRKSINQSWQEFAEQYGLDYEINKDTRKLIGEYQGYTISVDTRNVDVRGHDLQTYIMLFDLRISPDMYLKISPYNILDNSRKLFRRQENTAKTDLEQHFKVIAQPKHLAYEIFDSTQLCQRLLKLEAHKIKIEAAEGLLFFQQSAPPDKVENWQFLLNTLCILARKIERVGS